MCEISLISRAKCPSSRQIWPVQRPLGAFQAHSCLQRLQLPARHQHLAQRKHHLQPRRVLGQTPVAHLGVTELLLDHPERVLHLRPDAGLDLLDPLDGLGQRSAPVQRGSFARAHGNVPYHLQAPGFGPPVHSLVASVSKGILLLPVQQSCSLSDVVDVGRRADDRMHQARLGIHADVCLHPEVPLVALLRLAHLRVALALGVLGRTGRGNQCGIHQRAGLEHEPLRGQMGVDRGENLRGQLLLLQQVAKPQDRRLVRQPRPTREPRELPVQRAFVQFFLHGRVAQVPPQLQAVDAQHRVSTANGGRPPRAWWAPRARLYQCHHRRPRHHPVHLFKEDLLAGLLGQGIEPQHLLLLLRHARHLACGSLHAPVSGGVLQTVPNLHGLIR